MGPCDGVAGAPLHTGLWLCVSCLVAPRLSDCMVRGQRNGSVKTQYSEINTQRVNLLCHPLHKDALGPSTWPPGGVLCTLYLSVTPSRPRAARHGPAAQHRGSAQRSLRDSLLKTELHLPTLFWNILCTRTTFSSLHHKQTIFLTFQAGALILRLRRPSGSRRHHSLAVKIHRAGRCCFAAPRTLKMGNVRADPWKVFWPFQVISSYKLGNRGLKGQNNSPRQVSSQEVGPAWSTFCIQTARQAQGRTAESDHWLPRAGNSD